MSADGVHHVVWKEQPEDVATCLALKPCAKGAVSKYVRKFKLYSAWFQWQRWRRMRGRAGRAHSTMTYIHNNMVSPWGSTATTNWHQSFNWPPWNSIIIIINDNGHLKYTYNRFDYNCILFFDLNYEYLSFPFSLSLSYSLFLLMFSHTCTYYNCPMWFQLNFQSETTTTMRLPKI